MRHRKTLVAILALACVLMTVLNGATLTNMLANVQDTWGPTQLLLVDAKRDGQVASFVHDGGKVKEAMVSITPQDVVEENDEDERVEAVEASPSPTSAEIKVSTTITKTIVMPPRRKVMKMYYYNLTDPRFGLVDSTLTDDETHRLISGIREVWNSQADVELDFEIRNVELDEDRAGMLLMTSWGGYH